MRKLTFRTQKQRTRYDALLPFDIPKKIRVYDNGGPEVEGGTADRYTCVFTGNYTRRTGGVHWYIGFSRAPFHPQGIGHHGEAREQIDVLPGSWGGPRIGGKCHLGTRIRWEDLNDDGKQFVWQTYVYLWDLTDEDTKEKD